MQLLPSWSINAINAFKAHELSLWLPKASNDMQIPKKKNLHRCYDTPTKISPPLKKLYSDHHYKVTKDPWLATPLRYSPSVSMA